jgi:DHA1 family inner membrane transport protein
VRPEAAERAVLARCPTPSFTGHEPPRYRPLSTLADAVGMTTPRPISGFGADGAVSATLFASLFAAQAGVIAVTPLLADLAADLEVSTAVAGQLRTVTGLAAGVTALALGWTSRRIGLGRQLLVASMLLALGSLASAAAPTFALLALAQVPVGVAVGALTSAATVAAAEWVPPERRTRVLSWALIGQPAAWIVGMPLVGFLGQLSWRLAWLGLPFVAAVLAGAALARRAHMPSPASRPVPLRTALAIPTVARWLGAETLANTAWAGTLVYSGALFVEAYDLSTATTGVVLAVGAAAYVAGNRVARRLQSFGPRNTLAGFTLVLTVAIGAFDSARMSFALSVGLFSIAAFAAGARTLLSSAYGLAVPTELRTAMMGSRAASMQLGYLVGASAGGLALLAGGYAALGLLFALLFLASALLLAAPHRSAASHGARRGRRGGDLIDVCAA